MAMKTPTPTPTPTTNVPAPTPAPVEQSALAIPAGLNLFQPPPAEEKEYLVQVKIPYPIEVDGVKFKGIDSNQIGFYDGSTFEHIPAPFTVYTFAAREASRKLLVVKNEETGKDEKRYERAYKSLGSGFDKSHALFEQHLTDPLAERGVSYVVAIISGEKVAIAEISAFKVQKDLWGKTINQARNGMGCVIKLSQLESCLTTSKSDAQKKYVDPKKFVKYTQIVQLSESTLDQIKDCLAANIAKFNAWMKR